MRHRNWIASLWAVSMLASACATPQIPDEMLLDGVAGPLMTEPLAPLLRVKPELHQKLRELVRMPPCTASWRGYRANWEIRDNRLYLREILANPCDQDPVKVPLQTLFAESAGPIEATWFSGALMVPRGKPTEVNPIGYSSRFERYVLFRFERGVSVSRQPIE